MRGFVVTASPCASGGVVVRRRCAWSARASHGQRVSRGRGARVGRVRARRRAGVNVPSSSVVRRACPCTTRRTGRA
ncbi:hypothetical protein N868_04620 [Cellulomonas carbonis T26]|uniref:Uncharacterized protein n=1 Tax=Cellulomonas carbonis T26 TaxID=947969 RepID=A0A0A0BPP4_9CELL|nr:hypothetical protein N868_04620 [Cellulomonas carbonis T26]